MDHQKSQSQRENIEKTARNQQFLSRIPIFKDIVVVEGEEYEKEYLEQFYEFYNRSIVERDEEEEVTITFRRRGILDNNEASRGIDANNFKDNGISINFLLKHQRLSQTQLERVLKYLKKKNMCLEKYINSGGEADVYLGYIVESNGNKVEKVFRIVQSLKNEDSSIIEEEYKKVASISTPNNIIQYEGFIQLDNIFVFIMEKYEGSLKDIINEKMTPEKILFLIIDLFDGLVELRLFNIIHSDIKPANILMDKKGRCHYSDFGMAFKLNDRQSAIEEIKGYTEKYCSPEHQNGQALTYSSDMYSLGVVILQLADKLEDAGFKKIIVKFVKKNLVLEMPEKRILVQEVIPAFLMKISPVFKKKLAIRCDFILDYVTKIELILTPKMIDNQKNQLIVEKIDFSYKLVEIILYYFIDSNSHLISFNSLSDVSFKFLSDEQIAKLLITITEIKVNFLSDDKKIEFIQLGLLILNSLPCNNKTVRFTIIGYYALGVIFLEQRKYQSALVQHQIALSFVNDSTEQGLIADIYKMIGYCQRRLDEPNESIKAFEKCIELKYLVKGKCPIIEELHEIALCYEDQEKKDMAQEHHKKIVENSKKNFELIQNEKNNTRKSNILIDFSDSLYMIGNYPESLKISIDSLRLDYQIQDNFQEIYSIKLIKDNIKRLTSKERENALDKIIKDNNNDFIKKLVLYEFASDFYSNFEADLMIKALNCCQQIEEDLESFQEFILKIMFVEHYLIENRRNQVIQQVKIIQDLFLKYKEDLRDIFRYFINFIQSLIRFFYLKESTECLKIIEEYFKNIKFEDKEEECEYFKLIQLQKRRFQEKFLFQLK